MSPDQAGEWGQARRHTHRHIPGPGVHGQTQEASGLEIEVPEVPLTPGDQTATPPTKNKKRALAPCNSLLAHWEVPLESSPPRTPARAALTTQVGTPTAKGDGHKTRSSDRKARWRRPMTMPVRRAERGTQATSKPTRKSKNLTDDRGRIGGRQAQRAGWPHRRPRGWVAVGLWGRRCSVDEVGKWLLGHRRVRDGMAAKPRLGAILTREASSLRPRGPVSAKAAGQGAGVERQLQSFQKKTSRPSGNEHSSET